MLSETEKAWLQCQQPTDFIHTILPWVFLVIADLKKQKQKDKWKETQNMSSNVFDYAIGFCGNIYAFHASV